MDNEKPNIPDGLLAGGAGAKLWLWLHTQVDPASVAGCEPLAVELCLVADRLQEVRAKIAKEGLTVTGPRGRATKNSLLDVELKLERQYILAWRSLGLADRTEDPRESTLLWSK